MDERVYEVLFAEGTGWQVVSEGKVLATVHSQDRGRDRAILAAKRHASEGGVGVVRVLTKAGTVLREHAYGKATVRRRILTP
jgi:hydrogenase maturation factor